MDPRKDPAHTNEIGIYNRLLQLLDRPIDEDIWLALKELRHVDDVISYANENETWEVTRDPIQDLAVKYEVIHDFRTWREGPQPITVPGAPAHSIVSPRAQAPDCSASCSRLGTTGTLAM